MPDSTFLSLVAIGGSAFFGLCGAVGLAIKYFSLRKTYLGSNCEKASFLKSTHTSIFQTACIAMIFYSLVLFILIGGAYQNEIQTLFLNALIIIALLTTGYYVFKMFFRLQIICIGCIRIHLANLMMSSGMLFYNLQ